MATQGSPGAGQDALLAELESIHDVYRTDVKQFIAFVRERKLAIVDGFKQYAKWLEEEHDGKLYSPATINRKVAAARSRVRYAFKHSAHADSLQRRYRLEDILKSVKAKKIDTVAVPLSEVLDVEEARSLARQTRDKTIRLMVNFLVRTGVRVSEMLGVRLEDLAAARGELVQVRVRGKAGKVRVIYVRKDFVEEIKAHLGGKSLLFEHDGRPYNRISVTNRIKNESLKILGREVTPQQLRHTWAAIQIKRGKAVSAVAAVLGHSDPGLTARMYPEGALKPEEAFLDLDDVAGKKAAKKGGDGSRPRKSDPSQPGGKAARNE